MYCNYWVIIVIWVITTLVDNKNSENLKSIVHILYVRRMTRSTHVHLHSFNCAQYVFNFGLLPNPWCSLPISQYYSQYSLLSFGHWSFRSKTPVSDPYISIGKMNSLYTFSLLIIPSHYRVLFTKHSIPSLIFFWFSFHDLNLH